MITFSFFISLLMGFGMSDGSELAPHSRFGQNSTQVRPFAGTGGWDTKNAGTGGWDTKNAGTGGWDTKNAGTGGWDTKNGSTAAWNTKN